MNDSESGPARYLIQRRLLYFTVMSVLLEFSPWQLSASALQWSVPGLNPNVLSKALQAESLAEKSGVTHKRILGIIDYSMKSTEKRFWVLDFDHQKVLFYERVAHGKGSGDLEARHFSNSPGSFQSSLGLFLAKSTYYGVHGYSLKLKGLDPGINDHAEARAIVIHGAWYVNDEMIAKYGRLGRSWGCPTVSVSVAKPLIDSLKSGGLLFTSGTELDDWKSGLAP